MTDPSDKLSAYLDGELPADEAAGIEAWLARDPDAQAQLEALMQVDTLACDAFRAQLAEPVPLHAARLIQSAKAPAPTRRPLLGAIAAGVALLLIGGAGGYALNAARAPIRAGGWLQDVAAYHAVYAGQTRHLVEVGADQADHLRDWLGKTIDAPVAIPDLSGFGFAFQGGRLLVAGGRPVGQLMYRAADGRVIALCLQRDPGQPAAGFARRSLNGFDLVSWSGAAARYVVIGPAGEPALPRIARAAAQEI